MAEETPPPAGENKEAAAAPASKEGGKGGGMMGALIPAVIVVVLVPVLTLVVMQMMILPKIKHEIETAAAGIGAGEEGKEGKAEGGAHGSKEGGGEHGGKKGKGGGEHGGEGGKEGGKPGVKTYQFENIVANLAGSLQSRYVKVSFMVEGVDGEFTEKVEANKARLVDATITALSALSVTDLEKPGIKNTLKNNLLNAYELVMNEELIQQLYFSEFVVQ